VEGRQHAFVIEGLRLVALHMLVEILIEPYAHAYRADLSVTLALLICAYVARSQGLLHRNHLFRTACCPAPFSRCR